MILRLPGNFWDDVKQEMGEVSLKLRLPVLKGNAIHEELGKQVKNDLEKIGFQVDEQALDQGEYLQQVICWEL